MVDWNARDVVQLLDFFTCYHTADLVRYNRCKEVLRLINKHRGSAIATFFRACHESEKTLRQHNLVVRDSFNYADTCHLVNNRIVEKILSCQSIHQTVFKTRICDWH